MRTVRLVLAAAAVAGAAAMVPASAHPDPLCRLWWPNKPSITDNGDGTYTVDPGTPPQWVC